MDFAELLRRLTGRQDIGHTGAAGTIDLGLTEALSNLIAPKVNASGGSDLIPGENTTGKVLGAVAPVEYAAAKAVTPYISSEPRPQQQPQQTPPPSNELSELEEIERAGNLNPAQRTRLNEIKNANPGGGGGIDLEAMLREQRALARSAYEEGMRRANSAFDRARGLYDEGTQLIGKRRGEFQNLFDTGNQDITAEYQGRGGELGTAAQNRRTTDAAALQAQGFGGSAVERAQNRQSRDEIRGLGGLMQNRDVNKRENKSIFDERQTWADTQEAGLRRGLETAEENRRAAEAQAGLIERGDQAGITNNINSFLSNILQNQQALDASTKTAGAYEANPYAVNIGDATGALRAQLPTGGATGAGGVQNVNLDEQKKKLALLGLQAGGNMYGLA